MIVRLQGQLFIGQRSIHDGMGQYFQADIGRDLGPADRRRGAVGQALGEGLGRIQGLRRRGDMIDQAHALGILCADRVAGHQILLGLGLADQLQLADKAALTGHHANLDMGTGDLGLR